MSTIGEKLGRRGRPRVGVGHQMAPEDLPQPKTIVYGQYSGIDESYSPIFVPYSAGLLGTIDVEMTPDATLIRAPGIRQVEEMLGHSYKHAMAQTAPDGSVELFVIDAPDIGVRTAGLTTWTNVGLPLGGKWVAANHGGVEVFSNGVGFGYARHFGVAAVENLIVPGFKSVASIFARLFVAGPYVGGATDGLRIMWSGASGGYGDWIGPGSGDEALVSDLSWADHIIALRPHGRDLLCILMRHSIWIGVPTGDLTRPADFRSVVAGTGCVAESTARTTKFGVAYLSDDGVHVFDGNDDILISAGINQELLPIDYTNLAGYHAAYDPYKKRYILTTPACTWIYDFMLNDPSVQRPSRWHKRSFIADSVFSYADQAANPTWDDSFETWDESVGTWDDDVAVGIDSPARLFFSTGAKLGREDYSANQYFNLDFTGKWRGAPGRRDSAAGATIIQNYEIYYRGGGRIQILTPDMEGQWTTRFAAILPEHGREFWGENIEHASEGIGAGLEIWLYPPGTIDVIGLDLVVTPGETEIVRSTAVTPEGVTITVEAGGLLITSDTPLLNSVPEIARISTRTVDVGPKNSGGVTIL